MAVVMWNGFSRQGGQQQELDDHQAVRHNITEHTKKLENIGGSRIDMQTTPAAAAHGHSSMRH